jgi:hypothetical protein
MSLDCGGAAIVVELDSTPERAWMKSLKRALQDDDVLQGAQAKFDGRFVYVVGVEGGAHRAQHRVIQALKASAGTRTRAPAEAPGATPAPQSCPARCLPECAAGVATQQRML